MKVRCDQQAGTGCAGPARCSCRLLQAGLLPHALGPPPPHLQRCGLCNVTSNHSCTPVCTSPCINACSPRLPPLPQGVELQPDGTITGGNDHVARGGWRNIMVRFSVPLLPAVLHRALWPSRFNPLGVAPLHLPRADRPHHGRRRHPNPPDLEQHGERLMGGSLYLQACGSGCCWVGRQGSAAAAKQVGTAGRQAACTREPAWEAPCC